MISIEQIDHAFRNSVGNKNYINTEKDGVTLTNTDIKVSRLSAIFTLAHGQLNSKPHLRGKDISQLRALQEIGKLLYERYENSTKSWVRTFLKGLAKYTPKFLKQFLPSCFSNRMEGAERETRKAYDSFNDLIKEKLNKLTALAEEQKDLQSNISKKIEALDNFDRHPISLPKFKNLLWAITRELISLYAIDPDDTFFTGRGLTQELSLALFPALNSGNTGDISSLLSQIGWDRALDEAAQNEDKSLSFTLQKIGGVLIHKITSEEGTRVRETQLDHYRGSVKLSIDPGQGSDVVDVLIANLREKPNFLPYSVIIHLSAEQKLASPLTEQISELIRRGIEVDIRGLSSIDLGQLSPASRSIFFEGSYPQLRLPSLNEIVIGDNEDYSWNDDALTHFLALPEIGSKIKVLDLQSCRHLTTDILIPLTALHSLEALSLPDLPQGKNDLDRLPRFDDPLKIKLFYIQPTLTRQMIFVLYTGPIHQAVLYQIPLAKLGEKRIFFPSQRVLDHEATARWFHDESYAHLDPQLDMHTVIAYSNPEVTDASLEAFVKKFPNLTHLSLYDCDNITIQGVMNALQWCTKLQTLDLTKSRQISGKIFLDLVAQDELNRFGHLKINATDLDEEVDPQNPALLKKRREDINLDIFRFPELNLCFKIYEEEGNPSPPFRLPTSLLYAESPYFRKVLSPGQLMFQNSDVDFVNIHATPPAVEAFTKLIRGKLDIKRLEWRVAADLAELIGPKIFKLHHSHYEDLLRQIRSHFDIDEADDFLLTARQLDDGEGINEYESLLINYLECLGEMDFTEFHRLNTLAEAHQLLALQELVEIRTLLSFQNIR